jgi:galactitol PTS system EIIB component
VKRVVVACGSGVATSTMVAELLKNALVKRGVQVEIKICDFKSLRAQAVGADLLVSIAPYEKTDYGLPVVNGIPLLTGVGADNTVDEVVKILSGK